MSEQEPKPQLHDNCDNCEQDYDITKTNAAVFAYEFQPQCNNILAVCPHCKHSVRMFIDQSTKDTAEGLGIRIQDNQKMPTKELFDQWRNLYEVPELETYDIPPTLEKTVGKFALALEHMPPDFLYDELTSDHPTNLPNRWI